MSVVVRPGSRAPTVRLLAGAVVALFFFGLTGVALDASFGTDSTQQDVSSSGQSSPTLESAGGRPATETSGGASTGEEPTGPGGIAAPTGSGRTSTGAAASTTGSARATGSAAAATSRGVTATEIRIGFEVSKPIDYTAFGGAGTSADDRPAVQAFVDWINAHGGIAGRKVVPFVHLVDVTTGDFAAQAQEACVDFTEDKKVFAAISVPATSADFACYAQHATPYLNQRRWLVSDSDMNRYADYAYLVARAVSGDRWIKAWVDGLVAEGYFDSGYKLGVVRYDSEAWRSMMANVLRPALAAHGIQIADEEAVTEPPSAAALSEVAAQTGNAILKFRTNGINHVLFLESGGAMPFLFMPAADSQGYRPRYGFDTMNAIYFLEGNVPKAQMHASVGVGWYPADDTTPGQDPGLNESAKLCIQILTQAGQAGVGRGPLGYCDAALLLKRALDGGPAPTAGVLRRGIEALGSSFQSPSTFSARFGPTRHQEAASARFLAFDDGCGCFRYGPGGIAIP